MFLLEVDEYDNEVEFEDRTVNLWLCWVLATRPFVQGITGVETGVLGGIFHVYILESVQNVA